MSENNVGQPQVKLEDTTGFSTPEGNKIFQQGVLLRSVSKFVAGTDEDAVMPIPVFFCPDTKKIVGLTLPPEIRDEYKDDLIEMTVFDWLNEITVKKTPFKNFTQQDWDDWNSYMVHRFLSMNMSYIDIVNFVQNINPQNKKEIYTIYREMIPKRKIWNKYIKNQNKKDSKELAKIIANKLSIGIDEASSYIPILEKEGVTEVLSDLGYEKKEIKKLIKTI